MSADHNVELAVLLLSLAVTFLTGKICFTILFMQREPVTFLAGKLHFHTETASTGFLPPDKIKSVCWISSYEGLTVEQVRVVFRAAATLVVQLKGRFFPILGPLLPRLALGCMVGPLWPLVLRLVAL